MYTDDKGGYRVPVSKETFEASVDYLRGFVSSGVASSTGSM